MFIAAVFTIARTLRQCECSSTKDWIQMWYRWMRQWLTLMDSVFKYSLNKDTDHCCMGKKSILITTVLNSVHFQIRWDNTCVRKKNTWWSASGQKRHISHSASSFMAAFPSSRTWCKILWGQPLSTEPSSRTTLTPEIRLFRMLVVDQEYCHFLLYRLELGESMQLTPVR